VNITKGGFKKCTTNYDYKNAEKLHNNNSLFSPFKGRTSQVKSTLINTNDINIGIKKQEKTNITNE